MTAMTFPAGRAAARVRPVPWTRLAWVTWRQHRAALAGVAALLGALALYLLIMGLKIHEAYAKFAACHPAGSAACQQLQHALDSYYGSQQGSVMSSGINAQTVPFLLLAVVLTAVAFVFSQLFSWYFQPFIAEGKTSKFPMQVFGNTGVAFAAWTLLAFVMAAFLGVVIRRTVPAMAATLTVWTVLAVTTMDTLRQHYGTPVTASGNNPPGGSAWLLDGWITGPNGKPVTGSLNQVLPISVQNSPNPNAFTNWLSAHHYTQWWSFQPGSRFWPFQLIEGGWLLALSLVLIAATVWLVRRRAA